MEAQAEREQNVKQQEDADKEASQVNGQAIGVEEVLQLFNAGCGFIIFWEFSVDVCERIEKLVFLTHTSAFQSGFHKGQNGL